jgi:F0F1-type ATP synthase assembly protein I
MIGAILFPAGVAVVLLKGPSFEAAPIAGSLIVVAAMAVFVVIVFQTSRARVNHRTVLSSAAAEAVGSR